MIRYALKCAEGHSFESWFQSADAFDKLDRAGHVACAVCGSSDVRKELMAPGVAARKSDTPAEAPAAPPVAQNQVNEALAAFKAHVEANSTYVGGKFAEKAREMHLGEAKETSIYGEAKPEEAKALLEEGVPIAPLPFRPTVKSN